MMSHWCTNLSFDRALPVHFITSREMRSSGDLSQKGKRTVQAPFPPSSHNSSLCSPQTEPLRFFPTPPSKNKVPYSADQHMRNGGNYRRPRTGHEAAKDGTARFVTPPLPLRHSRYLTSPTRKYACPRFPLCMQTRSPEQRK